MIFSALEIRITMRMHGRLSRNTTHYNAYSCAVQGFVRRPKSFQFCSTAKKRTIAHLMPRPSVTLMQGAILRIGKTAGGDQRMTQQPDFGVQAQSQTPVQGLIRSEGASYSNWGLHRSTTPAVFIEPISYADVQAIVRDSARFPRRSTRSARCSRSRPPSSTTEEPWSVCASSMR